MNKRKDLYLETVTSLEKRGVDLLEIAHIVVEAQKKYFPEVTVEIALEHIAGVLRKREVQHAILTGIAIDIACEKNLLEGSILDIIKRDEGLYGPDETLALSITGCYGSIASSNFGNFDINKPGIIGKLNAEQEANPEIVHTFLDDIVASIAASACSRLAHNISEKDFHIH